MLYKYKAIMPNRNFIFALWKTNFLATFDRMRRRFSLDDSDAQISDVFYPAAVHNTLTLAKLAFT